MDKFVIEQRNDASMTSFFARLQPVLKKKRFSHVKSSVIGSPDGFFWGYNLQIFGFFKLSVRFFKI